MCNLPKKQEDMFINEEGVLSSICKVCQAIPKAPERVKNVRGKNKDHLTTGSQSCSICGTIKPLEEYPKDKRRITGRYPRCRECVSKLYKAKKGV
jgi:hypothetical protein